jgi:hypothetical protein
MDETDAARMRRMGLASIVAGAGFFLGQGGELVFGDDSRPVYAVLVACLVVAIVSFGVAFWTMGTLLRSRTGRIGARLGLAGDVFLVAFGVQLGISVVDTGEVPQNFILFAIGFLLIFAAHLVVARPLGRLLDAPWWLSAVAGLSLLAALVVNEVFIWHDLALFVFEGCWVVAGLIALRRAAAMAPLPEVAA